MRAIEITAPGKPDVLRETERPSPSFGAGEALMSDLRQIARVARSIAPVFPGLDIKPLVAELQADLGISVKDADGAKAALMQVQVEIKKLKSEKDQMLAKMASAQARIRIQEQLEGLSVDAEVKALDTVRTHINNLQAQAKLGAELQENSLDHRLGERDLRLRRRAIAGTARRGLRDRLDHLRAGMSEDQGTP